MKRGKLLGVLSAVALTSGVAAVAGKLYSAQLAKPVAVTVVSKWDSYDSTGKYKRTRSKIIAVRGDGSQMESVGLTTPEGVSFDNRVVYDVSEMREVAMQNVSKSKTSKELSASALNILQNNRIGCDSKDSPRSSYRGYEIVKNIRNLPKGADGSELIAESWLAPALNCMELQRNTSRVTNGHAVVLSRISAQVIAVGEPDSALFQVPADYVERSQADTIRETERILGLPPRPLPNHIQATR